MKTHIREKLKRVHDLYPPERLEKSKARYRAMWHGQKPADRYPFVFTPVGFCYYNDVFSKEDALDAYLDEFIRRGFIWDDFIPAFFPGCKQSTIPSMFGAPEFRINNEFANEKILYKPEDIDNLPDPAIRPGTSAYEWLEMQKYFLHECEGEIPVHVCDMQGPVDVCGQLFGYDNLFLCAYEDEERFNKLMKAAADGFCLLWNAQKELLGDLFVGTHLFGWSWVPENSGASMSVDSMVMMSGDFFDKHIKHHVRDLADKYQGLAVHSCGNFGAVVGKLSEIENVAAVNASQMSVGQLLEYHWNPRKMMILMESTNHAEAVFDQAREHNLFVDVSFTDFWQDITDEKQRAQMTARADEIIRHSALVAF